MLRFADDPGKCTVRPTGTLAANSRLDAVHPPPPTRLRRQVFQTTVKQSVG
jgi:hypothetical protein